MSEVTTLGLMRRQLRDVEFLAKRPAPDNSKVVRNALLALLAANVFVISGALCFGYLYFNR